MFDGFKENVDIVKVVKVAKKMDSIDEDLIKHFVSDESEEEAEDS